MCHRGTSFTMHKSIFKPASRTYTAASTISLGCGSTRKDLRRRFHETGSDCARLTPLCGDSLRPAFRDYLEARDDWMDYLVDFRDALAHRIPLYVPPGSIPRAKIDEYIICERGKNDALRWLNFAEYDRLGAEQNKMLLFQPMMTHSLIEMGKLVLFHDRFFDSRRTWQQDVRGTESTLICGIHF